jgi:hypothetical protein
MLRAKSSQLYFYGNHIDGQAIPNDHFLKLLDKAYDNNKNHRLLKRNESISGHHRREEQPFK